MNGVSKMASALVRRGDLALLINLWAPQRLSDGAGSLQKRPVWGLVGCVWVSQQKDDGKALAIPHRSLISQFNPLFKGVFAVCVGKGYGYLIL